MTHEHQRRWPETHGEAQRRLERWRRAEALLREYIALVSRLAVVRRELAVYGYLYTEGTR